MAKSKLTALAPGLFISKGIVEAHGGSISVRNNGEYGKGGATFSFTIPLWPSPT